MLSHALAAAATFLTLASPTTPADPQVELWRLDCGKIEVSDFASFSDTGDYDGEPAELADSCYLIRHGDDYMLWDTGLPGAIEGKPMTSGVYRLTVDKVITKQLAQIGVKPESVRFVGISHRHFDHIGQAAEFPGATLLIGEQDLAGLKASTDPMDRTAIAPWLGDGAKAEGVAGDKDVFGDGSVVMLSMPGHTDGHHALLVRLSNMGPVMLSGDEWHARESYEKDLVPAFNSNRADTLASHDRFKRLAKNMKATVIIQHVKEDVAKLPAFPKSAK